jgi:citrate synthase
VRATRWKTLTVARTKRAQHDRLAEMAKSVSVMPGFNHPLDPGGDPRAEYLLDLACSLNSSSRRTLDISPLLDEATREFGARPSVETGLAALCHALQLPYRSAGAVLTIARCAGWIAHVIEQRLAGMMLRPRARYLVT